MYSGFILTWKVTGIALTHKVHRASLAPPKESAEVAHTVAFALVEHSTVIITPVL